MAKGIVKNVIDDNNILIMDLSGASNELIPVSGDIVAIQDIKESLSHIDSEDGAIIVSFDEETLELMEE